MKHEKRAFLNQICNIFLALDSFLPGSGSATIAKTWIGICYKFLRYWILICRYQMKRIRNTATP